MNMWHTDEDPVPDYVRGDHRKIVVISTTDPKVFESEMNRLIAEDYKLHGEPMNHKIDGKQFLVQTMKYRGVL